MRIIIGGAGRVGTELARALRAEEMDVVLVDSDSRAVKNAQNLDVLVIHGDLTTREKLHEAGIGEAEIFVACLLYTSPSPRDKRQSRMPSWA